MPTDHLYTHGRWHIEAGKASYVKQDDDQSGWNKMSTTLGIFTNKTDIFRALKQHMTADETVKMIFADPHYKDALTTQMSSDPKELTKFVALDLLVSLVIYNQNGKRDKELYMKLKPLIQSIFTIEELYDKKDLEKYGRDNDLFMSDEYEPTMEEIQNALPTEFLLRYVREKVNIGELFDAETIAKVINDHYFQPCGPNEIDITQVPCGEVMLDEDIRMHQ